MYTSRSRITLVAVIILLVTGGYSAIFLSQKASVAPSPKPMATSSTAPTETVVQKRNLKTDEVFVYETEVESVEDCSSYEEYDEETSVCYFECSSTAECEQIEQDIDDELAAWNDDINTNTAQSEDDTIQDDSLLATYTISNGEQAVLDSGEDMEKYQNIWNAIAALSPDVLSDAYIEQYQVYEDTESDVLAFVSDGDGNGKWGITVNLGVYDQVDLQEKKSTLIHELAHIISLNRSQLTTQNPCSNLKVEEGCAQASAYIQAFWSKYWRGISNPPYDTQKYVSEYATTDVIEDFAETFTFFVLGKDQSKLGNTVKDQKIELLATFPELREIRESMRQQLARDIVRAKRLNKQ